MKNNMTQENLKKCADNLHEHYKDTVPFCFGEKFLKGEKTMKKINYEHMKGMAEVIVCIAAIVCLAVCAVCLAATADTHKTVKDDVETCMDEIAAQYDWDRYAYTASEARIRGDERPNGENLYVLTVYGASGASVTRYEYLCRINGSDVDCELIRIDLCPDY